MRTPPKPRLLPGLMSSRCEPRPDTSFSISAWAVSYTHLDVYKRQRDDWSFGLTVNNLFDRRYYTASGNTFSVLPGDPRHVALRVTYAF